MPVGDSEAEQTPSDSGVHARNRRWRRDERRKQYSREHRAFESRIPEQCLHACILVQEFQGNPSAGNNNVPTHLHKYTDSVLLHDTANCWAFPSPGFPGNIC